MQTHSTDMIATIEKIVQSKKNMAGALLPILHALQTVFGFIPKSALPIIATALQQTEAEIYGVISFYAHFYLKPSGKHIVEICRGEACQAMASGALEQEAKAQLNIDYHQTTADRNITLEAVYCLGNCACAPSVKVGDKVYGRMNAKKFAQLTDQLTRYPLNLSEA